MELGINLSYINQDKQQYVETFLHIVRGSKSKNEFLKNIQQFDNKFTQAFQVPSFQNKASYDSFQSVQQIDVPPQRPKNPFINNQNQQEENSYRRNYSPARSNNFILQQQQHQQMQYYNQQSNPNKMNIQPSRSEQDFFKSQQQISKTYASKDYERQSFTQQFAQLPPKGPNFAWQTQQNYNQYFPPNYYEQQMKQNFNEMRKNFANFNINDQQKYSSYNNDLSINSHHNLPMNSGIDNHPNEFLAAFSREDQGLTKYYKAPIPYPPKQDNQNSKAYLEKRVNPFANQ